MARSCAQIVDEVHGLLQSFSLDESQSTTLAADIGLTDTALTVTSTRSVATGFSPGIIEIDQEMMFADGVDSSGNVTVPPWGRGYQGTPVSTHTAGARVISQPSFPRWWTMQAINETLDRVYPEVFAVNFSEQTTTIPQLTYLLPDNCERVLKVAWQEPGPQLYWRDVRRWRMSPGGGTQYGDSGRTVDVGDPVWPGRPILFTYASRPGKFASELDDFESTTGLGSGMFDVVVYGAASGLLTISQELSRLQMSSVEQQNRAQLVAPSAALTASSRLDQRFQLRLKEERVSLQQLYPPRIQGVWL